MNLFLVNQKTILNRGDHAIHAETLRLLRLTFPSARISLTFYDVESAREAWPEHTIVPSLDSWAIRVDSSGQTTTVAPWQRLFDLARLALAAIEYRVLGTSRRWFRDDAKQSFVTALCDADLVVSCGGGYLYDDEAPARGMLGELVMFLAWTAFVLGELLLPMLMGKPLVLLPQSIGPLRPGLKRAAIARIVRYARITFVRERESLALLRRLGCGERVVYAPDMAFGMASADPADAEALLWRAGIDRSRYLFCVGVTAIDWGAQQDGFGGQSGYEGALGACLDAITAQGGAVVLFSQCVAQNQAWDDRYVNRRLRDSARDRQHIYIVEESPAPRQLQAAYGLMDYFVATRMHSAILAINAGVPVLTIGYLHKSRGVMRELGLAHFCHDIGQVTPNDLVEGFAALRAAPHQPQARQYVVFARRAKAAVVAIVKSIAEVG